jgi:NADH:ubiquinone oxidoreductase subunit 6 (subunit J)
MKTIIFALKGIVVIAGIIILVVLLTKKDSNTDEGNKPLDKKYDNFRFISSKLNTIYFS